MALPVEILLICTNVRNVRHLTRMRRGCKGVKVELPKGRILKLDNRYQLGEAGADVRTTEGRNTPNHSQSLWLHHQSSPSNNNFAVL